MTPGRTVKKIGTEVTLSTGVTVWARKVSPYTMAAASKSITKPQPPMVTVDLGDGKKSTEVNEADPDYIAAVKEWQAAVSLRAVDVMLRLGVQVDIDQDALADLRAQFAALGLTMDEDDHLAYIKHIAIASEEDMNALAAAITAKSQPTEGAVQDHLDTFSDHTSGAVDLAAPAAEVGDRIRPTA